MFYIYDISNKIPMSTSRYLDQLNEVQRQAATHIHGPVLIVAGPGSGKTRVLTYRIAHLIESGIPPWEILALTFTNKAAREMKERIAKVIGERGERVWAGTFHSIFARILRSEAEKIGYPSSFTIYDTEDSNSVISNIIKEMHLSRDNYNTNAIRNRISNLKSNLITPKSYRSREDLMLEDKAAQRPQFGAIYEQYVARCKRSGAMDFDDLLYQLYRLFQENTDNVLDKYRERFRYLLVDEFQDTNFLQYAILKKLVQYEGSPRNVCVVGDDAQSIYAFRGATIQNILDYEADFQPHGIKTYKLEQNYRSTEHIVEAANQVIQFNQRQIQKRIWSDKGEGQRIKVIRTLTDNEEGNRVADTILEQKNRYHLSNSEIAILYRTNAQSRVFEEYLRRYNLNYRVYGGQSFYQRKEVKDLLAYLRLVVNSNDEEALRRALNYPKRGIGDATIEKISAFAGAENLPMWACLTAIALPPKTQKTILGFKTMIEDAQAKAATINAADLATYISRQSGLIDLLKQDTSVEGIGRLENVYSLLDGIQTFVNQVEPDPDGGPGDTSLAAYLQSIALITDLDSSSNETDVITLMSVHSAKGLEFKSVFLVGLEEKLFPSFMAMDSPEGLDEERRLFYVAITRAEEYLTLSYSQSRYRNGQMRYNDPSRFLTEIQRDHVESTSALPKHVEEPRAAFSSAASLGNNAGIKGFFPQSRKTGSKPPAVDIKSFKPSSTDNLSAGMRVLHLKFGEGEVQKVDGERDNRVATILFKELDVPERRIMLKFAKLQILS